MEKFSQNLVEAPEERVGVESVRTENGNYEIFYNVHDGYLQSGPIAGDRLNGKDALVLEMMGVGPYLAKESVAKELVNEFMAKNEVYRNIVRRAVENCTPIFLPDVSVDLDFASADWRSRMKIGIETLLGVGILLADKAVLDPKMTRRSFLEKAGKAVLAGYLLSPFARRMSLADGNQSEVLKPARKAHDAIHPELKDLMHEGRNALMAQKSEFIAKLLEKENEGRKPEIGVAIGAGHYGLTEELKSSDQERLARLKSFGTPLANEGQIIRIDFEKAEDDPAKREIAVTLLEDPFFKKNFPGKENN